ncbi:MAG: hypothetical protein L3J70_02870 [Gammaproteobacteria bacterium]|nr:hypothetical protein [Gammaproteobacteria bacterium]
MKKTLQKKTIYYIPIAIAFLALLSGCDEEGSSDDVNLSLALQDKGITWFSSETYGSGEWIQTTLKYDDLLFYSSETTHNKYTQSAAGDFQLEPQSTKNFVLTSSGWLQSDNKFIVSNINGGASIALSDSEEPLITKTLLASGLPEDLTDKEIVDHFNSINKDTGWTNKIIEGSLFNTDSIAYEVSLQFNTDRYSMWDLNCEEEFGCNQVWIQPASGAFFGQEATGLDDIPTETATNATGLGGLKAAFLTWDADQTIPLLAVEIVADGTANFYTTQLKAIVNDEPTFPASATKSSSNTWQEKEVFGKKLYLIEVPESLAIDFGFTEDSRHIVFFEHDGLVRRGNYKLTGHTGSFWIYNNSAKSDILDNLKKNDNNGNWQN